jgi:hypothetical protein
MAGYLFKDGSQDEMCISFVLNYPAKTFAGFPFICPYQGPYPCAQEYVSTDLSCYVGLGRIFGTPLKIVSNATLSEPSTSIEATESPTSESLEQVPSSPTIKAQYNEQVPPTCLSNANSIHCLFVSALFSVGMLIPKN